MLTQNTINSHLPQEVCLNRMRDGGWEGGREGGRKGRKESKKEGKWVYGREDEREGGKIRVSEREGEREAG